VNRFFTAVNAHDTIAIAPLFLTDSKGESSNQGSVQTGGNDIAHEFARNFAGDSILQLKFSSCDSFPDLEDWLRLPGMNRNPIKRGI
jgi:hypothetical protein